MDRENNKVSIGKYIVPVVAVAIFSLVLFGAGYAYFAATQTVTNLTNISATLPNTTTTLQTTSSDCTLSVPASNMVQSLAGTASDNTSCTLTVTLNGAEGVKCSYDVVLTENSASGYTPYAKTTGGNVTAATKEFTGILSATGTGITFAALTSNGTPLTSSDETQMDTLKGNLYIGETAAAGRVAHSEITVATTDTAVNHVYTLNERWYNIDANQGTHADKTYRYTLSVANVVC